MKKTLLLIMILISVSTFKVVLADEDNTDLEQRIADKKEEIEERRERNRERLAERQEHISNRIEDREGKRLDWQKRHAEFEERIKDKRNILETRLAERKSFFENKIAEREDRENETRLKLDERRKGNVKDHLAKIFIRFDAAIERLKSISQRIQDRIDKLEIEGEEIEEIQSAYNDALNNIEEAEASIIALKDALDNALESEISKETIKDLVFETKESIRSAHGSLVDVITKIKGLRNSDNSEDSDEDTSGEEQI